MSTQINITVGSGNLSDRASQLQTAARQAQAEIERTARIEDEATSKRRQKLEAEGLNFDGTSFYASRVPEAEIDRRPAATRAPGYPIAAFLFNYEFVNNQQAFLNLSNVSQTVTVREALPELPPIVQGVQDVVFTSTGDDFNGNTFWSYKVNILNLNSRLDLFYFPAGKDALIVHVNYSHVYYTNTGSSFEAAGSYGQSISTDAFGQTIYQDIKETTITVTKGQIQSDSAVFNKTWLVSSRAIKEIPTPVEFQEAINVYVPQYDTWQATTTNLAPITDNYTEPPTFVFGSTAPVSTGPLFPPRTEPTNYSGPFEYNRQFQYNLYADPVFDGFLVYQESTDSFTERSSTSLTNQNNHFEANFYRPGAEGFRLLGSANDPDLFTAGAWFVLQNPEVNHNLEASAESIKLQFFNGVKVPDFSVVPSDVPTTAPTGVRYDILKALVYGSVDTEGITIQKNSASAVFPFDSDLYLAWDWGNPGYCREQILAFGFSPEDLA